MTEPIKKPGVGESNRARWAKLSPKQRSNRMKKIRAERTKNMTQAEKNALGKSLTASRLAKRKTEVS